MSGIDEKEYRQICNFIFLECQLADEGRWEEWEELLAADMNYWVPINGEEADPNWDVSIINDNRSRLATRIRQLRTGTRHSQAPISVIRRMVSNIVMNEDDDGIVVVEGNFVAHEYQNQSTMMMNIWPGRVRYRLRRVKGSYEIVQKRVDLVMSTGKLPTLAFII
ncbi:MAG: nuclear transport factor 2 family protein [Marinosulfonomonas sp.]|nr:nuclear transport factor 2 family protein [Marinosulfonomonas sp.]